MPALSEDRYDYVFTVIVQGNSLQLLTRQYGKLPRATIPK